MSGPDLTFGVLGPLAVWRAGAEVPLGGVKQRVLLASLLLAGGRPVGQDRLADALWGDRPPRSATANLHTYVSNLRAVLPRHHGDERIRHAPDGYLITVDAGESDLDACERLVARAAAARADGDPAAAAAHLEAADRLWRGEPLQGLPAAAAWQPELARLSELRLTAVEDLCELRRELGRPAENVPGLRALLVDHPLRESLWWQLLTSLAAAGQTAEAVSAYAELREELAGALGTDPGPRLRDLHTSLLRGDPVTGDASPFPLCQLPPPLPDFVGREDTIAAVTEAIRSDDRTADPSGGPPVVVLTGAPGVGKSAAALHAAHLLRGRFPDGQVFVDLSGPGGKPRDPAEALAEMLLTFDVVGGAVPRGLSERAALYRSKLADRRVLVVIDDASDAGQVRRLLPGTPGSAAIVTTRRALDTLPGAVPVHLEVLPEDAATALLTGVAVGRSGGSTAAAEPGEAEAVAAIVRACGCLPLALRIAGAKLRGRSRWSPRTLAERLADASNRLTELRAGDLAVRASFAVTVALLPPPAARAFRLLGLIGAPELPAWTIGTLLDTCSHPEPGTAEDALDALADASLVHLSRDAGVRLRMHDLLRQYGRELAAADPEAERHAAVARLLAAWLGLAERAAGFLPPSLLTPLPGPAARRLPETGTPVDGAAAAVRWFDTERRALLAAVALAAEQAMAGPAAELAVALVPYFDLRSLYDDWELSHTTALDAARAAGDRRSESVLLRTLAQLYLYQDRYDESAAAAERSRALCAARGDRRGVALAEMGLASLARVLGRHDEAIARYESLLPVFVLDGDRHIKAQVCASIGNVHRAAGRPAAARPWLDDALRDARGAGDRHRLARILTDLGELEQLVGDPAALDRLREALDAFTALDDDRCAAYARLALTRAHADRGETATAHEMLSEALATFDRIGNHRGRATAFMVRGELAAAQGDHTAAGHDLRRAAALWHGLGDTQRAADAHRLLTGLTGSGADADDEGEGRAEAGTGTGTGIGTDAGAETEAEGGGAAGTDAGTEPAVGADAGKAAETGSEAAVGTTSGSTGPGPRTAAGPAA